jgi:predicted helicase
MVRSVEDILQKEFGKSLGSPEVHILDPFVGTGNFIVHIMQEIKKTALTQKYHNELHCNEVMLLPYYIASMNIEHEFYERTGNYETFEGICLVDTFELAEEKQISFFSTENTARVERQRRSPIKVIIGNPPYNAKQLNENDNNKNRKYKAVNKRVSETYARDSKATLKNKLNDPYIKAIRWASDRIGEEGVVALVTNNSFLDDDPFDGVRKHLAKDFDSILILDLGGNVWRNPKLSGTTHNVFGIKVGVSINFFVRKRISGIRTASIHYARLDEYLRKEEKYKYLDDAGQVRKVPWALVNPDRNQTWLSQGRVAHFKEFLSFGDKETKSAKSRNVETIFKTYSLGVSTNRDQVVYDFDEHRLLERVEKVCDDYNAEVERYKKKGKPKDLDNFIDYRTIDWSDTLKGRLKRGVLAQFDASRIRPVTYRPFTKRYLYYDELLNDRPGLFSRFFPGIDSETENRVLAVCKHSQIPFSVQILSNIPSLDVGGRPSQCFPFYTYNEDSTNRRENITDWVLEQFRSHYKDKSITKWDIFHYVYAVLHHPLYRERYAANLKRELPRIPFAPDFRAFADIGKRLAEIHVNYEQQPEYPLERIEALGMPLDWRVEKMKLSKDKRSLIYNEFLTLSGIPPEVFEYRLGNRSALDWMIDQYQVSTDKRSGITNDPNRPDDPQYIVRLIGQVITVSIETVKLVHSFSTRPLLAEAS